jgi:hypothetical protein
MISLGAIFLILAIILIAGASVLDWTLRERMASIGHRKTFLLGGAFNYSEYHKVRELHGWPAWPVYVMWALYVCGIGLLIAGFFVHFGTRPHYSS